MRVAVSPKFYLRVKDVRTLCSFQMMTLACREKGIEALPNKQVSFTKHRPFFLCGQGPCNGKARFQNMTDAAKMQWAQNCGAKWPC